MKLKKYYINKPKNKETLEKLTDLITPQGGFELNTHEKLVGYGLSAEDATRCLADLETGKIVIVADDEL